MFERFTDRARRVLTLAQEEARLRNHSFIGTEHILLGLIAEGDGIGAQALRSSGVSLEAARREVDETIGVSHTPPSGPPPFTPRAKKVLELSLREALELNHSYIGTEHMLLGLIREGQGVAATVLVRLGANPPRVRREVLRLISGSGHQTLGDEITDDVPGASSPGFVPLAPCCPRCRAGVSETARTRTIVVRSDAEDAPPASVEVVYCVACGTTLQMFRAEG